MLRRLLAVGLGAVLVASVFACASPTLPLPPPEPPTEAAGPDADHVRLSSTCGGAQPYAIIIVVNENITVPGDKAVGGSIADGCGGWDAVVYAHSGDVLEVSQQVGADGSLSTVVQVR